MSNTIACFGELLLRFTPPGKKRFGQTDTMELHWAGSEANVAVSLAVFGESARMISAVPQHAMAQAGLSALKQFGVDTSRVLYQDGRLGIFYYEPASGLRNGKIIYDREFSSFAQMRPGQVDWDRALEGCSWLHWSGINAGINQALADVCKEALEAARKRGMRISADCNHRTALWNYGREPREIMPELLQYCDLIVADMTVGQLYYGIESGGAQPAIAFLQELSSRFNERVALAMTMRGKIAGEGQDTDYRGFLYRDGIVWESENFPLVDTAERIGSGDAFMAGLIYGTRQGMAPQELIRFATAAGALKHSIIGDASLATLDEIHQAGKGRAGTILR